MDLRQKVLLGLGWSSGARFLSQLVTWGITLIVIRLLTPEDYGLVAISGVFIVFLTMVNELGLGAALIQKENLEVINLNQVLGLLLVINFSFFLLLILVAPLIGVFFGEQRIVPIIRVSALQFPLMSFATIPQSLLFRKMDFRKISILDFTCAIVGSLTTLILALSGWGAWSLILGSMAIIFFKTIGLNIVCSCPHIPRFSLKGMRQIISFGGYVTISRILWFFFTQADVLIIGKLLGKELLGFYSVAMEVASLPMQKVSGIINQVAFPAFSSIQTDHQKVESYCLKAVRLMSIFAFPILWGISCISPELVGILLGDKWVFTALPLQLLSLVIPLRMIIGLLDPAVMGQGRPDISLRITLFSSVVVPLAILIGVRWGIIGVSLAWVVVYPLVFLRNLSKIVPVLGIRLSHVLQEMARPAAAALIMYAVVMGFKTVLGTDTKSIWNLVLLIICGAMVYGGLIITLHRDGFREVWELIRE